MITCLNLGRLGRMGNQMFQVAAVIGHALRTGQPYALPDTWNDRWGSAELLGSIRDLSKYDFQTHKETAHSYQTIPHEQWLSLDGYFQSWKYFDHCVNLIHRLFLPQRLPIRPRNTAFIHVRRGDYLQLAQFHPVQPMSYYEWAMDLIRADRYLVLSDDPEWCCANFTGRQFEIVTGTTPLDDLKLMASCSRGIIANSSFSWWGAWLGRADQVVAPLKWFGPAYGPGADYLDTADKCPPHWIQI